MPPPATAVILTVILRSYLIIFLLWINFCRTVFMLCHLHFIPYKCGMHSKKLCCHCWLYSWHIDLLGRMEVVVNTNSEFPSLVKWFQLLLSFHNHFLFIQWQTTCNILPFFANLFLLTLAKCIFIHLYIEMHLLFKRDRVPWCDYNVSKHNAESL